MKPTLSIRCKSHRSISSCMLMLISLLILVGCSVFIADRKKDAAQVAQGVTKTAGPALSPAQDYAGEILAYFLQIVVGHIGSEQSRQAWRSTGNDAPLDFQSISQIMGRPSARKTDLMVFDFDLLSLVEILSYYNPQFNLFKGQRIFNSVYPSSELIAVRLLMQRKLQQKEKVSFSALQDREDLLHANAEAPTHTDLKAINLSADEFQLVKDVFASDPLLMQYYKHPFIVEAMTRIGFYQKDRLTETVSRRASYRRYRARSDGQRDRSQSVAVMLLPSFTQKFEFGGVYESPYIYGFKPMASYRQAIETLKNKLLSRTAELLIAELKSSGKARAINDQSWRALWENVYAPLIDFKLLEQRPFTIYPEIADRMVKEICPAADLVIVLLGEGMDRAIDSGSNSDSSFPYAIRYLNVEDIRYFEHSEEIDKTARSIVNRLLAMQISACDSATGGLQNTAGKPKTIGEG